MGLGSCDRHNSQHFWTMQWGNKNEPEKRLTAVRYVAETRTHTSIVLLLRFRRSSMRDTPRRIHINRNELQY